MQKPTKTQLKDTQLTGRTWINGFAGLFSVCENFLTQLVTPQFSNGECQKQPFQSIGVLQTGICHVKPAGFIVTETLFRIHANTVFAQARWASALIRYNRQQFRSMFIIASGPSHRQIGAQFQILGKQNILKESLLSLLDTQFINSADATIFQGDNGIVSPLVTS